MVKKNKQKKRRSRHHIKPKSRGGKNNLENIIGLDVVKHRAYHTLFGNQTPDEIVEELVNNYWNGQWEWVEQAYGAYQAFKDGEDNSRKKYTNRVLDWSYKDSR